MNAPNPYLEEIEQFWLALRGSGIMVSAVDVQLIEQWRDAGLPARVVCAGLADGLERYRDAHGDDQAPASLRYLRNVVEEAGQRWLDGESVRVEAPTATDSAAETVAAFGRLMEHLVDAGRGTTDERLRQVYRQAYRRLSAIRKQLVAAGDDDRGGSLELIAELGAVDEGIVHDALAALSDDERRALESEVQRALDRARMRLGKRALADRERELWADAVSRRFQLLRLVPAPARGPRVSGMGWAQYSIEDVDEDEET